MRQPASKGRLRPALPNTISSGYRLDAAPEDSLVELALRFAGMWRRLADLSAWYAGLDGDLLGLVETLGKLGWYGEPDEHVGNWLDQVRSAAPSPVLLQAGWAGRSWRNLPSNRPDLTPDSTFLTAATWKKRGHGRAIPLPFWSAPSTLHNKLSLKTGLDWSQAWLIVVDRAARLGLDEPETLRGVERRVDELPAKTKPSRLSQALRFAIRQPVFTASTLARHIKVTAPGASALVKQLEEGGFIREATLRKSWRAFTLK